MSQSVCCVVFCIVYYMFIVAVKFFSILFCSTGLDNMWIVLAALRNPNGVFMWVKQQMVLSNGRRMWWDASPGQLNTARCRDNPANFLPNPHKRRGEANNTYVNIITGNVTRNLSVKDTQKDTITQTGPVSSVIWKCRSGVCSPATTVWNRNDYYQWPHIIPICLGMLNLIGDTGQTKLNDCPR